ncbi:TDP-N-acetylfucosamine:lipid II N-acetylfucosaminyltransferase [Amphibacillus cookii]|uniref:TDP-N-acetylfucosamine:lipid II N-acetylfucosaminyltransferase n=1 Tax=Amphibacillus cookii TaxID=767787 RepID=UPI001959F060|nr:TDP-N-acetylfucosamine:lipid II N-acetylfucosaminyltransferase [Amphibacillus cookii]MBM7539782.1 hypothetical protein [Amphibacillus cookii]
MKYLHVFSGDENQKFSSPFIAFIKDNFDTKEHRFLIQVSKEQKLSAELKRFNTISANFKGAIGLLKEIRKAEKVYFHGLNLSKYSLAILSCQQKQLQKCNWIIWGGDLYQYHYRDKSFQAKIKEIFRKGIIRNIGGLITHLYGDYELAKKWYGAKGNYYYSFIYPSNLYKEIDLNKINKEEGRIYIQVGNSADSTNEHIEVFEKLAKFKNENIEIICPLSYSGKQEYVNEVIDKGMEIFGEGRFLPILEFMLYEDYLNLLGKVDVAIFNHRRQRGLGNISTLLSLGKKVYIREEITTWSFCEDHGLVVYSANNDFKDVLEPISTTDIEKNHKLMKEQFSKEKLVSDWKKIFLS